MSQLTLSLDTPLMVRDGRGRYRPADADQILEAARQVIEQKMQRGATFTSPEAVKDYLRAKLAGFEHEVFAVLFLDTRHRLIDYVEMFRGTIDAGRGASARGGEAGAAAQCGGGHRFAQPSERESRAVAGRQGADAATQGSAGAARGTHVGSYDRGGCRHGVVRRARANLILGASAPFSGLKYLVGRIALIIIKNARILYGFVVF